MGHLIYLSGEVGIGAGIIYDGKPMLGSAGYAGEVGHTLINPAGRRCRCGATGCWETEAGEMALARAAGLPASITGLDVVRTVRDRADAGDQRTLAGIAEIGRWLGLGIGSLINTFNPELIVLGGIYHALFPYVRSSVLEGAAMVRLDAPAEMVEVTRSGLGPDAPLIGAAELALSAVVTDPASAAGHSVLAAPTVGGGGLSVPSAGRLGVGQDPLHHLEVGDGVGGWGRHRSPLPEGAGNASACTSYWSAAATSWTVMSGATGGSPPEATRIR